MLSMEIGGKQNKNNKIFIKTHLCACVPHVCAYALANFLLYSLFSSLCLFILFLFIIINYI